ncbi:hypothetical protein J8I87_27315 [Paraburkholderia sp. LEh10]|uniref:hypothetical protein n=1 Tax=Paraburkholderia sp. LEh10 TaxID=2821353 RepID=UPI001AEB74A0|nr:hypothetical protein [Paraburkholderia sp. LEh10]MBP0593347.1 hypothetical protein [Paraburkholderia sp. LEh10]
MSSKLIATLVVAVSACVAAPAFASGYGPAPYYRPETGAPASQQGLNAKTLAQEQKGAGSTEPSEYGGVNQVTTQNGARLPRPGTSDKGRGCVGPVSYCNTYFGS